MKYLNKILLCLCLIFTTLIGIGIIVTFKKKSSGIKTLCPFGAPALAFYSEFENKNFHIQRNIPAILKEFNADNYDFIVADLTNGLRSIASNPNSSYKLCGFLTACNLFAITAFTNKKLKKSKIHKKKILAFGIPNSSPRLICQALQSALPKDNIFEYKDNAIEIFKILKNDFLTKKFSYDFYIVPGPLCIAFSELINNKKEKKMHFISLYQFFKQEFNAEPIQAALFVNEKKFNLNKKAFFNYCSDLEKRVNFLRDDKINAKDKLEKINLKNLPNFVGISEDIALNFFEYGNVCSFFGSGIFFCDDFFDSSAVQFTASDMIDKFLTFTDKKLLESIKNINFILTIVKKNE